MRGAYCGAGLWGILDWVFDLKICLADLMGKRRKDANVRFRKTTQRLCETTVRFQ